MVAKLLEYVNCIIRVCIVLLCPWYVPKIHFYVMVYQYINCVLQLHLSHACVEAMRSMMLSKGLAVLLLRWVTAW